MSGCNKPEPAALQSPITMPFIYIVEPMGSPLFKVGMTLKIESALGRYLTHCGYFKMTFFDSESPRSDEAYMHRELLPYHELAEFFCRGADDCVFNRAMDIAVEKFGPPVLRHDEAARLGRRKIIKLPVEMSFDREVELAAAQPAPVDGGPDGLAVVTQRILWAADAPELDGASTETNVADGDRWREYADNYKMAWGLDRLDEPFIQQHGVRATSPRVAQLIRVLYPPLRTDVSLESAVTARASIRRTPIILEAIVALGFRSPFDTDHTITDLMVVWEDGLKNVEFFNAFSKYARLFNLPPVRTTQWSLNTISKALGALLGSVGLKLESIRKQAKTAGKKTSTFSYRLDADNCAEMLELVRLKMRGSGHRAETPNAHARELVLEDAYPLYGHLLDQDRGGLRLEA